jgi:triosephosphate isomerase
MHKTAEESAAFIRALRHEVSSFKKRLWIAPSFVSIPASVEAASGSSICIGAQNIHSSKEGAFTGEVSASMVKSAGASFVILGHSERRRYAKETDADIKEKFKSAIAMGLIPILCVGETLSEREAGRAHAVIRSQIEGAAPHATFLVAYEPVWAIGTGKVATPELAQQMHCFIRSCLEDLLGREAAEATALLYGGSVTGEHMVNLMQQTDIDGVLVGGASLQLPSLIQLIES